MTNHRVKIFSIAKNVKDFFFQIRLLALIRTTKSNIRVFANENLKNVIISKWNTIKKRIRENKIENISHFNFQEQIFFFCYGSFRFCKKYYLLHSLLH